MKQEQITERPRLGTLLERLETIRRELDREDLELEDQLALYREGCQLAAQAQTILGEATAEVEMLAGEEGTGDRK